MPIGRGSARPHASSPKQVARNPNHCGAVLECDTAEALNDFRKVMICHRSGSGSLDQSGMPWRITPLLRIQKIAPGGACWTCRRRCHALAGLSQSRGCTSQPHRLRRVSPLGRRLWHRSGFRLNAFSLRKPIEIYSLNLQAFSFLHGWSSHAEMIEDVNFHSVNHKGKHANQREQRGDQGPRKRGHQDAPRR